MTIDDLNELTRKDPVLSALIFRLIVMSKKYQPCYIESRELAIDLKVDEKTVRNKVKILLKHGLILTCKSAKSPQKVRNEDMSQLYSLLGLYDMPKKSQVRKKSAKSPQLLQPENEDVKHLTEEEIIQRKKDEFKAMLEPYLEQYGRDILNSFYRCWAEPVIGKAKLRWETKETWDLGMRLATWANDRAKINKK